MVVSQRSTVISRSARRVTGVLKAPVNLVDKAA